MMKALRFLAVICIPAMAVHANAQTVVRIATDLGDVDVRLFETESPNNTQNFLNYVLSGRYDGSVLHRADPGFVLQGGSFTWDGGAVPIAEPGAAGGFGRIDTDPPINSEATTNGLTNVRGTIAFALSGDPNSATSGFFFNVAPSNAFLDAQGFTVFAEVIGNGMEIVDQIMGQPTVNRGQEWGSTTVFSNIPTIDGSEPVRIISATVVTAEIPEPSSVLILGVIASAALTVRRRR